MCTGRGVIAGSKVETKTGGQRGGAPVQRSHSKKRVTFIDALKATSQQQRQENANVMVDHAIAPKTRKSYSGVIKQFDDFIAHEKVSLINGWAPAVTEFASFCNERGIGMGGVDTLTAALAKRDIAATLQRSKYIGFGSAADNAVMKEVIKGGKKLSKGEKLVRVHMTKQLMAPILEEGEEDPMAIWPRGAVAGVSSATLRATALSSFAGLFRPGEYLSPSIRSFDPATHLNRGDWQCVEAPTDTNMNDAIVMLLFDTKTEEGTVPVLMESPKDKRFCVKAALIAMIQQDGVTENSKPMFMDRSARPLTPENLMSAYRAIWDHHGIDHKHITLYSFRKGGAVYMVLNNDSLEIVRKRGRWAEASGSVFKYLGRFKPGGEGPLQALSVVEVEFTTWLDKRKEVEEVKIMMLDDVKDIGKRG
jgi:hypothetical protein